MGFTHAELSLFDIYHSVGKLGCQSSYIHLLGKWKDRNLTPIQIAEKVFRFFRNYAVNHYKPLSYPWRST